MDKKVILFDIDKTLMNPFLTLKDFETEIQDKFKRKIDVFKIYAEYIKDLESSTDFYPIDFLKVLSKKTEISFEQLNHIFYNSEIWENNIYEGTKNLLNKINSKFDLGIFSEGFDTFQNEKLKMAKLDGFFKKDFVFISRRKIKDDFLKILPEGAIIVDDKKEVIKKLKEFGNFQVVWVNREQDKEKINGVTEIKNLKELENFI